MIAPASHVQTLPGRATLEVNVVGRDSTVTSSFATSPLKLLSPRPRGQSVWAYTSSFGGGLVAGDQTCLDLKLGAGARCFLSSQASTKVYRNPSLRPCGHVTRAKLDAGSLLVFAPDPVQSFAGSSYTQRQTFDVANGASLVLLDWFCSGRAARGERWAFECFSSRNEVWRAASAGEASPGQWRTLQSTPLAPGERRERVFFDRLLLDSKADPIDLPARMGRFNCLAMLLLMGEPLRAPATQLIESVSNLPVTRQSPLVCSASPVRGGALLRIGGEHMEDVARELQRHLAFLPNLLGDDPWSRKW